MFFVQNPIITVMFLCDSHLNSTNWRIVYYWYSLFSVKEERKKINYFNTSTTRRMCCLSLVCDWRSFRCHFILMVPHSLSVHFRLRPRLTLFFRLWKIDKCFFFHYLYVMLFSHSIQLLGCNEMFSSQPITYQHFVRHLCILSRRAGYTLDVLSLPRCTKANLCRWMRSKGRYNALNIRLDGHTRLQCQLTPKSKMCWLIF